MPIPAPPSIRSSAKIFGIPIGELGLFASLLIAVALGFMSFFAVTFLSIFGLMIYNGATHHHVGLDASYKYIALPTGLLILALSLVVLVGFWLRNRLTGHRDA